MSNKHNTKSDAEVAKFDALAGEWWDLNGEFKLLHEINPLRLQYIRQQVVRALRLDSKKVRVLEGLDVLDIGCGGGLVSVPLHNMGANVVAIDASPNNIATARSYAERRGLNITFLSEAVEDLSTERKFDVVVALEVVEHVENPDFFLKSAAALLKKGGVLVVSTINRTTKSFVTAKIGAEYILKIVPAGTHDWSKFLTPAEIEEALVPCDMKRLDASGMGVSLLSGEWRLVESLDVNYFMTFQRTR